jgi:hypothetical protein
MNLLPEVEALLAAKRQALGQREASYEAIVCELEAMIAMDRAEIATLETLVHAQPAPPQQSPVAAAGAAA